MLTIEQISRLTFHNGSIYALTNADDSNTFLSAGSEGVVVKWNVLQPEVAIAIAKVEGQVFSLLFLPEKNHLVIGTMSGGLHVVDLSLKKEIHYITYHEQSIFDLKLHNQELFAASKDGTISVWSLVDYSLKHVVSVSDTSLRMIDFHPQLPEIAVGSSDNRIYLIDLNTWKTKYVLQGPDNSVFSVRYSPDGTRLLAGSRDAQLYVFDLKDYRLEKQIKAHLYTINDLRFINGGKFLATASRDKTIRFWDADTFELLKSLDKQKYDGHINSVNKLLWLPVHHYLVSASDDRSIIIWKVETSDANFKIS